MRLEKKSFVFILLLFVLASCDKDDDNNLNLNWTVDDLEYMDIKYFYNDTINSLIVDSISVEGFGYKNETNTALNVNIDLFKDLKNNVVFQTNDSLFSYFIKEDTISVHIPSLVDKKLFYSTESYKLSSTIVISQNIEPHDWYSLSPNTQLKVKGSAIQTKYNGKFEITYYNRKLQIEQKLQGYWTRSEYSTFSIDAKYEDIK